MKTKSFILLAAGERKHRSLFIILALISTFISFQFAFAGWLERYGKIQDDPVLERAVRETGILPDYSYYYTGRSHLPYAVIGIDPALTIAPDKFWHRIESRNSLTDKISNLMPVSDRKETIGKILDPDGRQIGIWFSGYDHTVVRMISSSIVEIFNPYMPSDEM